MAAITTRLRPLGRRVILKKIEESTRGGIKVKPEGVQEDEGSQEYEVESLPSLTQAYVFDDDGLTLIVGMRVYLALHKGWKIETNAGDELYAADVDDILAVEEDADVEVEVEAEGAPF